MFVALRIARGIIGFLLLVSTADVLNPLIKKSNDPSFEPSVTDSMWFDIFLTNNVSENTTIGIIAIFITGALFFASRSIINSAYSKMKGNSPPYLKNIWSL